jgi:glycosyltransferase involved in cell wall biosynthesis
MDVGVSVIVTSYNHEAYVGQALRSVLGQDTSFSVEVLVGDDCSHDASREVIRDAVKDARGKDVSLFFPSRNLGGSGNVLFSRMLAEARGRYIALLDGDDFWLSHEKLQRQVGFLEHETDCALCFHNVLVVDDAASVQHSFYSQKPRGRFMRMTPPPRSTVDDLVGGNFVQACSVVLRREAVGQLPDWFRQAVVGDWPLYLIAAQRGSLAYLDETWAAYRVHPGGLWSSRLSTLPSAQDAYSFVHLYQNIDRHLGYAHAAVIRREISRLFLTASIRHRDAGSRLCAIRDLFRSLSYRDGLPNMDELFDYARVGLSLASPQLHVALKRTRQAVGRVPRGRRDSRHG